MKTRTRNILVTIAVFMAVAFPPQVVHSAPDGWEVAGEGIEYKKFVLSGPVQVFVARMDRSNPNVTIESSIAQGRLYSGVESVRQMAARYDQAINYWGKTWGNTNKVVVAINGFFFDRQRGTPWSGQIQSSWYSQRFTDVQAISGFAWQLDRQAIIGNCVYHVSAKNQVIYVNQNSEQTIDGVNTARDQDQLILYTPQYDANTHTDDSGAEVLVQLIKKPTLVSSLSVPGVVEKIYDKKGSTPIPFDHVVLSATGAARDKLLGKVSEGDPIEIHQEISNCPYLDKSDQVDWTNTYASIGGDKIFLKNGKVITYDDQESSARAPRTAIAFNDQYIFFIVVDGYNPGISIGMSINQVANFALNKLGATWGVSQDSGSSSTMVVNGKIVNNVYCNYLWNCNKSLSPESVQSLGQLAEAPLLASGTADYEPAIGNGLMMVVVQPKRQASSYQPDDPVTTSADTAVRLGPGTNYAIAGTVTSNSHGVILSSDNNMNGVWAKGSFWWKIKFNSGVQGWIPLPIHYDFFGFMPLVNR